MYHNIIYGIFLECCLYCVDSYWRFIFMEMSQSRFPKGCYVNNGIFIYRTNNRTFSCSITDDVNKVYIGCYEIMYNQVGLRSYMTKIGIERDPVNGRNTRRLKNNAIVNMLLYLKNTLRLTNQQIILLYELLNLMLLIKLVKYDELFISLDCDDFLFITDRFIHINWHHTPRLEDP